MCLGNELKIVLIVLRDEVEGWIDEGKLVLRVQQVSEGPAVDHRWSSSCTRGSFIDFPASVGSSSSDVWGRRTGNWKQSLINLQGKCPRKHTSPWICFLHGLDCPGERSAPPEAGWEARVETDAAEEAAANTNTVRFHMLTTGRVSLLLVRTQRARTSFTPPRKLCFLLLNRFTWKMEGRIQFRCSCGSGGGFRIVCFFHFL